MPARAVDILEIGPVLVVAQGAENIADHQLGKADDRVQRRSQLVADLGQEFDLGAVRVFGGALGILEQAVAAVGQAPHFALFEAVLDRGRQFLDAFRLVDEVASTLAQRHVGLAMIGALGHGDAEDIGPGIEELPRQIGALSVGAFDVAKHHRRVEARERVEHVLGRRDAGSIAAAFEVIGVKLGTISIAVDDQHIGNCVHRLIRHS